MFSLEVLQVAHESCKRMYYGFDVKTKENTLLPAWRRGIIWIGMTLGALGFILSLILPIYLYLTTSMWWVDIVACWFGTYFISKSLLDFDRAWVRFEATVFMWRARLFGTGDLQPPSRDPNHDSILDPYMHLTVSC